MKFSNLYKLFLILFLAVGVIRFWKIPELGYFKMDEERDAFLVRRMLVDRRPLLIGGSIPGGINVGPAFFYISAIPYYLSRLNPIGPAWAAGLVGIIGVIGVFWVGKELFGRRVGLLAAVLAGFSLLNVVYQRPWWPLTMSQVVTLVSYLALFNISKIRKGYSLTNVKEYPYWKNWLWVLVVALILGAQSDPSTLSLIPLSIIWLWRHRRRIELTGKHYLAAVGLFLLAHASWVVFELRHGFQNIRAIFGLFKGLSLPYGKESPYWIFNGATEVLKMTAATVYRLFIPTGPLDVAGQISPADVFLNQRLSAIWWPLAWIMLIIVFTYVLFYCSKRYAIAGQVEESKNFGRTLIGFHFLVSMVGVLIYTTLFPGYVHEWMWFFMFPGFFLMAADVLVAGAAKVRHLPANVGLFFILIWVIWHLSLFMKLDNVAGLEKKLAVVKAAQAEIAGRPYELRSEGEGALRYGGWRYLFTLYGNPPVKSYMDYVYQGWVYPKNEVESEVVVVVNNPRDKIATFTLSENSEYSESRISPENQNF